MTAKDLNLRPVTPDLKIIMGDENVNFINILLNGKDSEGRKDQKKMFYDFFVWKNGRKDLLRRLAYETSTLYKNATVQSVYHRCLCFIFDQVT